ncbi:MAG: preprotein translocase subunit SecY [Capsulimonadales bacterium]|nr:preprotein translocase subunit SecY [Capsulimonadales bacterium]
MLEKLAAAIRVPDIRTRLQFVMTIFAVYVLALHVPAAGVDHDAMQGHLQGVLGLVDVFSGGALKKFSVIAMGIMPYINASIIMQLLTVAIPQLQAKQKEGESGRKEISKITRYASVGLGLLQAFGIYQVFSRPTAYGPAAIQPGFLNMITIMITLTAGTMFLLWLGEQITEKGIGNGISLMIFVGIMVSIPTQVAQTINLAAEDPTRIPGILVIIVLFLASIVGVIYMTQAQRKIPVHHMKRIVGNRMTQESTSYLPLKINTAGVIPIIFATSILLMPATLATYIPADFKLGGMAVGESAKQLADALQPGNNLWASLIFFALVLFFTYFYTAIQYDTNDIADNLKKYGSFIPGIKPGRPTAEYLDKVLTRITLAGAVFLAVISLIQYWAPSLTGVNTITLVGGTSLLIVVGVAMETMQAIEAQMAMRNYEGFIKSQATDKSAPRGGRPALGAR